MKLLNNNMDNILYSLYDKNTINIGIKNMSNIINCIKENVYNSKVIVINNIFRINC